MSDLTLFELILGIAIGMWPVTVIVVIMTIGLAISEWRDEREAKRNRREIIARRHIVADMRIRKEVEKLLKTNSYYFTFGAEGQLFRGGYIQIKADSLKEAQEKFIKRYGKRAWKGGSTLNYAFHYTREQFMQTDMQYGACHGVIE